MVCWCDGVRGDGGWCDCVMELEVMVRWCVGVMELEVMVRWCVGVMELGVMV